MIIWTIVQVLPVIYLIVNYKKVKGIHVVMIRVSTARKPCKMRALKCQKNETKQPLTRRMSNEQKWCLKHKYYDGPVMFCLSYLNCTSVVRIHLILIGIRFRFCSIIHCANHAMDSCLDSSKDKLSVGPNKFIQMQMKL